jgi:hypothetical protein
MIHQMRILQRLGLSEEQKSAVRKVLDGERQTLTRQVSELTAQHLDLEKAIHERMPEATLREKAAALGRLYGDVAVVRVELAGKFGSILTDEQRRRAAEIEAEDEKQEATERGSLQQKLKDRLRDSGLSSLLDES